MSIKLTQVINGITITDCIVTVGAISISQNRTSLNFNVGFYATEDGPLLMEDYFVFTEYSLEGDNPVKQAYAYLKGLDRFKNADNYDEY